MKKENGYDKKYTVNEKRIFDKSKEQLQKILEDFPNRENIIAQIFEIKSLYSSFSFYTTNVYTF